MSYKWPGIPNGDYSFDHGRAVWNKIINYLRRLSEKLDADIVDATADRRGMMTAADKDKLDGVEPGAEVNQNAFSGVKVGSSTIEADGKTDVVEFTAGAGIALTVDTSTDTVTIAGVEATTTAAGLMSASDKSKLDGIQSGAEVNQNAFSNIQVGPAIVAADSKTDTLTLGPGAGVIISANTTNDSITIGCVEATQSVPGIMSTADKTKLDGVTTGAEVNQNAFSNVKVGSTTVTADAKTDTLELEAGTGITLTPDATNDKVTIKVTDNTYAPTAHTHDDYVLKTGDTMTGMLIVPAIRSQSAGNVQTKATGGYTGLVIKDAGASADSTPNNGMVIEIYKNNANYAGQLFLGDNATQGLYWNGWSSGTYGVWKKFIMTSDATYTVGSTTKPVYVNNGSVAACTYELNKTVPSNAVFTDTVTTASTSGSGNAVTDITANNGALTVKKDSTFLLSNGNAVSASKLQTARTISAGDLEYQGSVSFDGSANVNLNVTPYAAHALVGNTNNYPYHYIGTTGVLTGNYVDAVVTFLVGRDYKDGGFGICRVEVRTNNASSGGNATCNVRWLVRDPALPVNCVQVGFRKTPGDTIADIYYVCQNTYNSAVFRVLGIGIRTESRRIFTLNDSQEVSGTTASDPKTSTYSYKTIAAGATALHSSKPYTDTIVATDEGTVKSADNGISEQGSNYVKFNTGQQICWGAISTTRGADVTYTFPRAFKTGTVPFVVISRRSSTQGGVTSQIADAFTRVITATYANIYATDTGTGMSVCVFGTGA